MPIFEYRCPDCTQVFDKLVSFSEAGREVHCPTCGTQASKLLSTFAAIGVAGGSSSEMSAATMGGGGGCCGGGCCGGS
jgi:putative FmdB family regulatory protein